MVNFSPSLRLGRIFLCGILIAFSMTAASVPLYATAEMGIKLNEIVFSLRVEKRVKKINKYSNSQETDKLIGEMFKLKQEVEAFSGKKISLDQQFDRVERDIKKNGGKLKKSEMSELRKTLKRKEKRQKHKSMYLTTCLEYGLDYDEEEEYFHYVAKHGHDKDADDGICPLRVTLGVTVALCGFYLDPVRVPICQAWAPKLIKSGVALAVEGTLNRA